MSNMKTRENDRWELVRTIMDKIDQWVASMLPAVIPSTVLDSVKGNLYKRFLQSLIGTVTIESIDDAVERDASAFERSESVFDQKVLGEILPVIQGFSSDREEQQYLLILVMEWLLGAIKEPLRQHMYNIDYAPQHIHPIESPAKPQDKPQRKNVLSMPTPTSRTP